MLVDGLAATVTLWILLIIIVVPIINKFLLPPHPTFGMLQLLMNAVASVLMVMGTIPMLTWSINKADLVATKIIELL